MSREIVHGNKKKLGRPVIGHRDAITTRLDPATLIRLDAWIAASDNPSQGRSQAIRALVERGLENQ